MLYKNVLNTSTSPHEDSHRRILSNLIIMFQREIEQTIQPELKSDYSRFVADMMAQMMSFIADWVTNIPYEPTDARRLELAGGAATISDGMLPPFSDPSGLESTLQQSIASAAANADSDMAQLIVNVGELYTDFLSAQKARYSEARERDRSLMAQLDIDLVPELFTKFAQDKMSVGDDSATSVQKIPGGASKDTFLVRMNSGQEYIVRRDFPFGPTETSAPDEFDLLDKLREEGLPVPKPIFAEYGRALGQPVLVMEKIEGENAYQASSRDPAIGREVALVLAKLLAQLHKIEPKKLGLTTSSDRPQLEILNYIAKWRRWWERNQIHPSALLEAGFSWLERNVPTQVECLVPIHGDARQDNMMYHNGVVTALLDWEHIHVGDPSEDLQYAREFVEPFIEWDDFLSAYQAAGGREVSEDSTKFYEVFRSLRNVVCVHVSWAGFVTGRYPSFKLASQGLFYRQMLEQSLAKSLAG